MDADDYNVDRKVMFEGSADQSSSFEEVVDDINQDMLL